MTSVLGNVINTNGNKVYALSANKAQFEFVEEALKNHKPLRKSHEYKNRLELIQDFHFSTNSGKVRVTKDGNYIGACGMYPPDLKVFECEELSMKFVRRVDCEIVDFQFVSEDYKKLVILENDRTLDFHGQGGHHHKLRIPAFGRSLAYDEYSAQLAIATNTNKVFQVDLEEGAFLKPLQTSMANNNTVKSGLHHRVLFVGGATGMEVWDTRIGRDEPVCFLGVDAEEEYDEMETNGEARVNGITSIAVRDKGFLVATGSATGVCKIYDLRHSDPLIVKDHAIDSPIVDMLFVNMMREYGDETGILSADERFIKLWDMKKGTNYSTFESQGKINGVCQYPRSGLVFVAQDEKKVGTFYVDCLGLAPRWASFLDNLVEEMEDANARSYFDNYEFVTLDDFDRQGLDFDQVKDSLKPHTHGFLIPRKLYRSIREKAGLLKVADTFTRKMEKLLYAQQMRPHVPKKELPATPSINNELKEALRSKAKKGKKYGKTATAVLEDERFKELFTNMDFAVERV